MDNLSSIGTEYTRYLIVGGDGFVVGVRDDAPDVVKIKCDEFFRKQRRFKPGD